MAVQQRAKQTREALLAAAAVVFDSKGFDAATIGEIVEESGLTRGALYFHFDSKEALARAIIAEQAVWLSSMEFHEHRPLQDVVDLSFTFAQGLRDSPLLRASIRLTVERGTFRDPNPEAYGQWEQTVAELIEQAQQLHHVTDQWRPADIAQLITGSITGLQLASEVATGREDLPGRLQVFWAALLPGITTGRYADQVRIP